MILAFVRLTLAACLLAFGVPVLAAALPDLSKYPILDDKQLGQINAIVKLAQQPDSDWSSMGSQEPGQGGFDAYRYQLAMMSYTLSLANYHYTPAFRELDQSIDTRLIDKMQLFDVWGFWEATSRGAKSFDPDLIALVDGWIDPVKHENIMYSGHLFQMINTHEMLYDDLKYDQPNSIKFIYNPIGRGLGKQEFDYDIHTLAKVLVDQFQGNAWKGIECEPNAIFPECNQHPLLGFALYDRKNGTDYFPRISTAFKKQFDALNYIDPKTSSFMAMYLVRQQKVIPAQAAWADGWAGSFMHAWYKPQVETIYPIQKSNLLVQLNDGTVTIKSQEGSFTYSWDHGFFALLAAEVGDTDTRDRMLAYAEKYWAPKWSEGAYLFSRQDRFRLDGDGPDVWRRVQPLTGNGLIGLARIDTKDGLYDLFNKPFGPEHFLEPYIHGVSYPNVQVARAIYDQKSRALVVTLRPGNPNSSAHDDWTIDNLDPAKSYGFWRDGQKLAELKAGVLRGTHDLPSTGLTVIAASLHVQLPIDRETSFILTQE